MQLTPRALNRALLARQGLLKPFDLPLARVVESIGALQAQRWAAIPTALWPRVRGFETGQLFAALERRELVMGTSIRRTLHLVSAEEHPSYAAVADAGGLNEWWRSAATPTLESQRLRVNLLPFLADTRTAGEICNFVEEWLAAHPGAISDEEQALQRKYKWRPLYTWSALVRAPADGQWSAKTPAAFRAAPCPPSATDAPPAEQALADLVRCHLRAFGPAAADDIATWVGWKTPPVRQALEALAPRLERFEDHRGRVLYDLPEALRPDPETTAPARFLPAFDSTLLAYAHRQRERILAAEHKGLVYARANLQVLPTVLIDGKVAGLWSSEVKRRVATLTVRPFDPVPQATRAEVEEEGEKLVRFAHPTAREHRVVWGETP